MSMLRERRAIEDENRRLRAEIEDMRAQERERTDRELDRAMSERREREQVYCEEARTARDWPEAFAKGLAILREFLREIPDDEPEERGRWESMRQRWYRAHDLYNAELRAVEHEIERLRREARERVAQAIEEQLGDEELAHAMREDDYEMLLRW